MAESVRAAPVGAAGEAGENRFGAYLYAHGAWFLAFGVQTVLFPYLVRVVLHESTIRFGFAQMSLQLPTTLLILVGGFVADHVDRKRIMVTAFFATVVAFLGLGLLVASGRLSYGLIIGYAVVVGTIGAFATPARDSLLSHITPRAGGLQQAVAFASLAQFGGQILGMVAAALAPWLGVTSLLFGQAVLMATAGAAATQVKPRPDDGVRAQRDTHLLGFMAGQIGGGFKAAIASRVIAPVLICSIGMGVCFFGAFAVLLPLVVQSYFPDAAGRSDPKIATALGVFTLCFWVGSMLSAMLLMRLGPLPRKGLVYLATLMSGSIVLGLCALPMPLWTLCGLNFVWGVGGGVAMTLARGLVQEHAPAEARARVLSIFTLGQMGGAPVGAVAYGYLAHAIGARPAILIPAAGMFAVAAAVALVSGLGRSDEAPPLRPA